MNRHTRCHYVPLDKCGPIPDMVVVNVRYGDHYDRAYNIDGAWYLMWNDKPTSPPDCVQVRRR